MTNIKSNSKFSQEKFSLKVVKQSQKDITLGKHNILQKYIRYFIILSFFCLYITIACETATLNIIVYII